MANDTRHWQMSVFRDRADAARRLAAALRAIRGADVLVLGLARGGVPIAAEIADELGGELDVIAACKAGAPGNPELALGAAASDGARYVNDDVVQALGIAPAELEAALQAAGHEAKERERRFRGTRRARRIRGRVVILADDGVATGATLRAAIRSVQKEHPRRLVVAVPVGAPESCAEIERTVDELVCLERPKLFFGVGQFYDSFPQVDDEEVRRLLSRTAVAPAVS